MTENSSRILGPLEERIRPAALKIAAGAVWRTNSARVDGQCGFQSWWCNALFITATLIFSIHKACLEIEGEDQEEDI